MPIINRVDNMWRRDFVHTSCFTMWQRRLLDWRYTGNKNGTMMGAKPGRQNIQNRNRALHQTPVQNLLLGAHWTDWVAAYP